MKAPHYRTVKPTEGSPQQLIIKPAVRTMCGGDRGMMYLGGDRGMLYHGGDRGMLYLGGGNAVPWW